MSGSAVVVEFTLPTSSARFVLYHVHQVMQAIGRLHSYRFWRQRSAIIMFRFCFRQHERFWWFTTQSEPQWGRSVCPLHLCIVHLGRQLKKEIPNFMTLVTIMAHPHNRRFVVSFYLVL